jgi:hypothetical protein
MISSGPTLDGLQFAAGPVEQRVLILAPTGNDASLTQRFLFDAGIASEIVHSISLLCEKLREGCGTLLLAEETLSADVIAPLLETRCSRRGRTSRSC